MVPQKSPPRERRSCEPVLNRSQSGLKLPFASVHVRMTVLATRPLGLLTVAGAPRTYRATFALSAVLPLPYRSYATPSRGDKSFHLIESVSRKVRSRVGTKYAGPRCSAGK